jgi:hypothetical protein
MKKRQRYANKRLTRSPPSNKLPDRGSYTRSELPVHGKNSQGTSVLKLVVMKFFTGVFCLFTYKGRGQPTTRDVGQTTRQSVVMEAEFPNTLTQGTAFKTGCPRHSVSFPQSGIFQ